MKEEDKIIRQIESKQIEADRIRQLEVQLKQANGDLLEYITAEKVLVAAGKVSEATVQQAHEIVRNLK